MKSNVVIINEKDNVAIALEDIAAGSAASLPDGAEIRAHSDVPYSHKIALSDLSPGDEIVKYGEVIGNAKETIRKGEWVHTHNLEIRD
ncbi:MAG TPA: UxaA family hydrolase [Spirochaetota bacterium]|nr:UxaA family hydrolase [Spirochaetota bacterium]